ncbi:MAG: HDOD domain-containing protein [Nitrospira sp.]|nr:HDOD domain-containing protein [Nitrospira sp.]
MSSTIVDNPESSMDDLANAIKIDPAISARLLKVVNSPLYGFPKQIDNISRAVNMIGMQSVSDLVAATIIGRTFSGMTAGLMDLPAFWKKSVLCALMAGKIAKASGIMESERFFIEGLLRDIGHLVLYQTVPQRAQSALIESGHLGTRLAEVEQSNIGCDFAEVGAELVHFWGMPSPIEQAIRHQLHPHEAVEYQIHAAELVHFWGMPSPIEQAIRHQLHPHEAVEYQIHASIVHLAGVVADDAQLETNQTVNPPPFDPFALSCTQFNVDEHRTLLDEAQQELQDTLAFISPLAAAA